MNRNRLLLVGVIALMIAGAVSWKLLGIVRSSVATAAASTPQVVVVAHDVNVGEQLAAADLKLVPMPKDSLPQGAFHEIAAVAGRGVLLPMQANEVVLSTKIAGSEEGAGLPAMIRPGMRAVSVKVNDVVSVAGFVVPGTHVDVIVTGTPTGNSDPTTATVLQDVPVLAAGKKLQRDAEGKPQDVPVITLLVSPADAQLLTLASAEGRIQLSLRNPTDVSKQTTQAVRNSTLYNGAPQAVSPKPKVIRIAKEKAKEPVESVYNVEIIRGDKRETTKF
jgi:pilus assembly protein CpaB